MELLLELNQISKSFKANKVLQNVDLKINAGDSIAFVGHNGSGKSTLLKIIGGFITYEGKISSPGKLKMNYVPEHFPKMPVTAREYVEMIGVIEGMKKEEVREKADFLFREYFMADMADTPIKFLSKGTIQKVAVVQAMLRRPDVLLLDEPLSGQDSDSQNVFIHMAEEMNKKGTVILMSCHEEWLIRRLSKKVYEIREKHLTVSDMLKQDAEDFVVLHFSREKSEEEPEIRAGLKLRELAMKVEQSGNRQTIYVSRANCDAVIRKMILEGFSLKAMESQKI